MKEKDAEINIFAAFFGQVLVGLKRHDLHRKFQGTNFSQSQPTGKIEVIHIQR